ncbi:MAG: ABC transporter substrate-binding protein, partial [Rhodococcus sp. (in: high G+C Gram-positive bacteria)]
MVLNSKAMRRAAIAATAASMLVLAGCSSDSDKDSGTSTTAASGGSSSSEGRGPITIVEGQDALNEALENIITDWNAEHPDEKVTLKPLAKEANA